jgi:hypothetical protein
MNILHYLLLLNRPFAVSLPEKKKKEKKVYNKYFIPKKRKLQPCYQQYVIL